MKFSKLFLIALIAINFMAIATSCSSNDDEMSTSPAHVLTEEEAVELIESSLQKSTAGFNDSSEKISESITSDIIINDECSLIYDDTFVINYEDANVIASYTVDWSYELTCNNFGIAESVVFASSTDGEYTTQHVTSIDNSMSFFEINGLQPSADELIVNGNYERIGMQEMTIINTRSINSTLIANLSDIVVDKSSSSITSGTASVTLEGTSQNTSFSFSGNLVFNGNDTATLSINGNSYTLNLG